jgi:hypothetical protein
LLARSERLHWKSEEHDPGQKDILAVAKIGEPVQGKQTLDPYYDIAAKSFDGG